MPLKSGIATPGASAEDFTAKLPLKYLAAGTLVVVLFCWVILIVMFSDPQAIIGAAFAVALGCAAAIACGNAYALKIWKRNTARRFRYSAATERPVLPASEELRMRLRVTAVSASACIAAIAVSGLVVQELSGRSVVGTTIAIATVGVAGVMGTATQPVYRAE